MKIIIKNLFIVLPFGLVLSQLSWAEENTFGEFPTDRAAGTEVFFSHDSDGFQTTKVSAEFFPEFKDSNHYVGVRASAYDYRDHDWSKSGQKLSLLAKKVDPATANGWTVDTGLFQQGSRTLLTFDGDYQTQLSKTTHLELFANRDWVETPTALDRGISFNFVGAAVDQKFGEHVTLVGLAGPQFFSDGNRRDHGRIKLIYQPFLDSGLTLQARYRTYHSTKADVDGHYFNPRNYSESMLAVGWRKRFSGWTTGLTAGVGREQINHGPSEPTQLFEFNLQSPVRGSQFLRFRAGYSSSASFYGPNYHYSYVQAEWVFRF